MNQNVVAVPQGIDFIGLINSGFLLLASIVALALAAYVSFLLVVKALDWVVESFGGDENTFRDTSFYNFAARIDRFHLLYDDNDVFAAEVIHDEASYTADQIDLEGLNFEDAFKIHNIEYSHGALREYVSYLKDQGRIVEGDEDLDDEEDPDDEEDLEEEEED